ncbi:MAG TPA: serine hydrolase domain-containing protein [Streptosporangiaceae bacterium]
MTASPARLAAELAAALAPRGIAGASAGIWQDGRVTTWSAGQASRQTGQPVTPATVFHLASVTKTLTAMVVLQLVAEGRVSLGQPAASVLPGLAAADAAHDGPVTIGSLLSHTSGIDADFFRDTGPGDDALKLFAGRAAGISRPFGPGQIFSYGNAGYSLLGRITEVVTGSGWDRQLRQRILGPLGMSRTTTSPERALCWPFAVGHESRAGGRLRVATGWPVPRSMGPAGVLCATAGDLLRFGAAVAVAGAADRPPCRGRPRRLIPADLAALMRQPAARPVYSAPADSWGLGWGLEQWGDAAVLGHDGGARGYESFLRVLPDHAAAVVLLVNGGGDAAPLVREVFGPLLSELCGVTVPPAWAPPPGGPAPAPGTAGSGGARPAGVVLREDAPPGAAAASEVTGSYACGTWRLRISGRDGAWHGELRARGLAAGEIGRAPVSLRLRPAGPGCFAASADGSPADTWPVHAVRLPGGTRLVHMWSRAAPAVQE